jgi:signal transduction histidine kinase/ActR/RegA family two-component response regulator
MADSPWNKVGPVVLTGTVAELRTATLPADATALVVDCPEPHAALITLLPRTAVPIILLSDPDPAGAARLVADGAEDVVGRSATFTEVARAVRHAAARRQRQTSERAADRRESSSAVLPREPASSQERRSVDMSSAGVPEATRPRNAGAEEMPPQLQVIGRLAGGVGHDFNNLLQVIGGSAEGLVHDLEVDDPRREAAQNIVDAARRAATLTHQLLAFGRRQTLIATPIDVSTLVSEALSLLKNRVGQRIQIGSQLAPGLPQVHADRSQILEVLSNLADNAVESMSAEGTLSISTDEVQVDPEMRRGRPWLRAGRFVRIQMVDTGAGIEEQALPHLFEPFFSTKTQWGGTGLGLSSVYGIIKQSGGFIWVDSQIGQGTRITILLPPVEADGKPEPSPSTSKGGRVVIVEDDEGVRELLLGVLTHYGYEVDAYGSAEEALAHGAPFDLLLSDVLLPGMNGPELVREMRRRHPGVPALLMSGDTGHVVDPRELEVGGFLQKPFSARTLAARVEELVAGKKKRRPASGR